MASRLQAHLGFRIKYAYKKLWNEGFTTTGHFPMKLLNLINIPLLLIDMGMKKITPQLAEIIGLLCAEGCHVLTYSSYWCKDRGKARFRVNDRSERIEFTNKDLRLLNHFRKLLIMEFDYKTKVTKHYKVNICKVNTIRQILALTNIGHLKWRVPKSILEGNEEVKKSFIRGYFDGDGSVSNCIRFFSTNKHGLKKVLEILKSLGFSAYFEKPVIKENRKDLYIIHIPNKQRERFLSLIQPVSKTPGNAGVIHKQKFVNP